MSISKIVLCISEKEDEILGKQIEMLKERHHAELVRLSADDVPRFISENETDVLFICDDEKLLAMAKEKGMATNNPQKMREAYAKAMEMLKGLTTPNGLL